jgi:hypothetical protein
VRGGYGDVEDEVGAARLGRKKRWGPRRKKRKTAYEAWRPTRR